MSLEVVQFIKDHPIDWEILLSAKPYSLHIKRTPHWDDGSRGDGLDYLVLLSYDQIRSDMKLTIVRECRGLILHIERMNRSSELIFVVPVCVPFYRFFEHKRIEAVCGRAGALDWSTARVQEKIDGSMIKVWYYWETQTWMISTRNTIDAAYAGLHKYGGTATFRKIFLKATGFPSADAFATHYNLSKYKTYIFELVGPDTRIIVKYDLGIYLIGVRDNRTLLEELPSAMGLMRPREYQFQSFDDVVKDAMLLPKSREGYVVVDGNWNRAKVKGSTYLKIVRMKSDTITEAERMILALQTGYSCVTGPPENSKILCKKYARFTIRLNIEWQTCLEKTSLLDNGALKKIDFVKWISTCCCQKAMYLIMNHKMTHDNADAYIASCEPSTILGLIEKIDP